MTVDQDGKQEAPTNKASRSGVEKSKLWKKLALCFATAVILLAAGEVFFRWIYPVHPDSRWNQHHFIVDGLGFSDLNTIMEPDPELFWRVKADIEERYLVGWLGDEAFLNFPVSTDSKGQRIMGIPERANNIVFLGDSCTFGIGVKAGETYVHLAGAELDLGVRNLSCPGYSLYQGRRLLDRMGWEPGPEALVVAFGFNDRVKWDGRTDPEHAKLLAGRNGFLARNSRFFYSASLALEGGLRLLGPRKDPTTPRMPAELFKAYVRELIEEAGKRDVPVVVVFWPCIEWMSEPGKNHPYGSLMDGLVDGKSAVIMDLAEPFRSGGGARLFVDNIHANPEGHSIAAKLLVQLLREMGVRQE